MTVILIDTSADTQDERSPIDTPDARPDSQSASCVIALTPEEQRVCDMATD